MVDEANPTPDELEDDEEGTPPGEPAAAPSAPEEPADRPTAGAPPATQAEYTRAQQAFAALKSDLGLPASATRADVQAAVSALKTSPKAVSEDDAEDEDPVVVQLRAERDEARSAVVLAQMEAEREISGPLADDVFRFVNLARTSNDVRELVQAGRELVLSHRDAFMESEAESEGESDEEPEVDIDLSEGAAPTARPTQGRRNRESAATSAVRDAFAKALGR